MSNNKPICGECQHYDETREVCWAFMPMIVEEFLSRFDRVEYTRVSPDMDATDCNCFDIEGC